MNKITHPSEIATVTRRNRQPRRRGSSFEVLLGSLGLALLATAVMWPGTTTAQVSTEISSKKPRPTARSSASARTVTSVAPDRRNQPSATAKSRKSMKKPRGRLPRYFGKVGLSAKQRDRIYGIQAMHRTQAEVLIRQLKVLRMKQDREVREVLTPLQQDRVAELIRMAEAVREARSRARRSSGVTPATKRKRRQ
ncbi:MAG: hypothetical protein VB859_02680 [Planctomycetaceae bacterium]